LDDKRRDAIGLQAAFQINFGQLPAGTNEDSCDEDSDETETTTAPTDPCSSNFYTKEIEGDFNDVEKTYQSSFYDIQSVVSCCESGSGVYGNVLLNIIPIDNVNLR